MLCLVFLRAVSLLLNPLAGISSVRLDVEETAGSASYTGLGEVAFNTATTSVPEPGSLTLLGLDS
jgi:hypothetical protein